jgi:hypothetical protein
MYESMSDEELLKQGEWLIFDDLRHTPANGMDKWMKDTEAFIAEMKRRCKDLQKWLDSLPTADKHREDVIRERIEKRLKKIIEENNSDNGYVSQHQKSAFPIGLTAAFC